MLIYLCEKNIQFGGYNKYMATYTNKPLSPVMNRIYPASYYARPALSPIVVGPGGTIGRNLQNVQSAFGNQYKYSLQQMARSPFAVNNELYMQRIRDQYNIGDESFYNAMGYIGGAIGLGVGALYGGGLLKAPLKSTNIFSKDFWNLKDNIRPLQDRWSGTLSSKRQETSKAFRTASNNRTNKSLNNLLSNNTLKGSLSNYNQAVKNYNSTLEMYNKSLNSLSDNAKEYFKLTDQLNETQKNIDLINNELKSGTLDEATKPFKKQTLNKLKASKKNLTENINKIKSNIDPKEIKTHKEIIENLNNAEKAKDAAIASTKETVKSVVKNATDTVDKAKSISDISDSTKDIIKAADTLDDALDSGKVITNASDIATTTGKAASKAGGFIPAVGLALDLGGTAMDALTLAQAVQGNYDNAWQGIYSIGLSSLALAGDVVAVVGDILEYTPLFAVGEVLDIVGSLVSMGAGALQGAQIGSTIGHSLTPEGLKAQQMFTQNLYSSWYNRPLTMVGSIVTMIGVNTLLNKMSKLYDTTNNPIKRIIGAPSYFLTQNAFGNYMRSGITMMAVRGTNKLTTAMDTKLPWTSDDVDDISFISAYEITGDLNDNLFGASQRKAALLGMAKGDPNAYVKALGQAWGYGDDIYNSPTIAEARQAAGLDLGNLGNSIFDTIGEIVIDPQNISEVALQVSASKTAKEVSKFIYNEAYRDYVRILNGDTTNKDAIKLLFETENVDGNINIRTDDNGNKLLTNFGKILTSSNDLQTFMRLGKQVGLLNRYVQAFIDGGADAVREVQTTFNIERKSNKTTLKDVSQTSANADDFVAYIKYKLENPQTSFTSIDDLKNSLIETLKIKNNEDKTATEAAAKQANEVFNAIYTKYGDGKLDDLKLINKFIQENKINLSNENAYKLYNSNIAFKLHMDNVSQLMNAVNSSANIPTLFINSLSDRIAKQALRSYDDTTAVKASKRIRKNIQNFDDIYKESEETFNSEEFKKETNPLNDKQKKELGESLTGDLRVSTSEVLSKLEEQRKKIQEKEDLNLRFEIQDKQNNTIETITIDNLKDARKCFDYIEQYERGEIQKTKEAREKYKNYCSATNTFIINRYSKVLPDLIYHGHQIIINTLDTLAPQLDKEIFEFFSSYIKLRKIITNKDGTTNQETINKLIEEIGPNNFRLLLNNITIFDKQGNIIDPDTLYDKKTNIFKINQIENISDVTIPVKNTVESTFISSFNKVLKDANPNGAYGLIANTIQSKMTYKDWNALNDAEKIKYVKLLICEASYNYTHIINYEHIDEIIHNESIINDIIKDINKGSNNSTGYITLNDLKETNTKYIIYEKLMSDPDSFLRKSVNGLLEYLDSISKRIYKQIDKLKNIKELKDHTNIISRAIDSAYLESKNLMRNIEHSDIYNLLKLGATYNPLLINNDELKLFLNTDNIYDNLPIKEALIMTSASDNISTEEKIDAINKVFDSDLIKSTINILGSDKVQESLFTPDTTSDIDESINDTDTTLDDKDEQIDNDFIDTYMGKLSNIDISKIRKNQALYVSTAFRNIDYKNNKKEFLYMLSSIHNHNFHTQTLFDSKLNGLYIHIKPMNFYDMSTGNFKKVFDYLFKKDKKILIKRYSDFFNDLFEQIKQNKSLEQNKRNPIKGIYIYENKQYKLLTNTKDALEALKNNQTIILKINNTYEKSQGDFIEATNEYILKRYKKQLLRSLSFLLSKEPDKRELYKYNRSSELQDTLNNIIRLAEKQTNEGKAALDFLYKIHENAINNLDNYLLKHCAVSGFYDIRKQINSINQFENNLVLSKTPGTAVISTDSIKRFVYDNNEYQEVLNDLYNWARAYSNNGDYEPTTLPINILRILDENINETEHTKRTFKNLDNLRIKKDKNNKYCFVLPNNKQLSFTEFVTTYQLSIAGFVSNIFKMFTTNETNETEILREINEIVYQYKQAYSENKSINLRSDLGTNKSLFKDIIKRVHGSSLNDKEIDDLYNELTADKETYKLYNLIEYRGSVENGLDNTPDDFINITRDPIIVEIINKYKNHPQRNTEIFKELINRYNTTENETLKEHIKYVLQNVFLHDAKIAHGSVDTEAQVSLQNKLDYINSKLTDTSISEKRKEYLQIQKAIIENRLEKYKELYNKVVNNQYKTKEDLFNFLVDPKRTSEELDAIFNNRTKLSKNTVLVPDENGALHVVNASSAEVTGQHLPNFVERIIGEVFDFGTITEINENSKSESIKEIEEKTGLRVINFYKRDDDTIKAILLVGNTETPANIANSIKGQYKKDKITDVFIITEEEYDALKKAYTNPGDFSNIDTTKEYTLKQGITFEDAEKLNILNVQGSTAITEAYIYDIDKYCSYIKSRKNKININTINDCNSHLKTRIQQYKKYQLIDASLTDGGKFGYSKILSRLIRQIRLMNAHKEFLAPLKVNNKYSDINYDINTISSLFFQDKYLKKQNGVYISDTQLENDIRNNKITDQETIQKIIEGIKNVREKYTDIVDATYGRDAITYTYEDVLNTNFLDTINDLQNIIVSAIDTIYDKGNELVRSKLDETIQKYISKYNTSERESFLKARTEYVQHLLMKQTNHKESPITWVKNMKKYYNVNKLIVAQESRDKEQKINRYKQAKATKKYDRVIHKRILADFANICEQYMVAPKSKKIIPNFIDIDKNNEDIKKFVKSINIDKNFIELIKQTYTGTSTKEKDINDYVNRYIMDNIIVPYIHNASINTLNELVSAEDVQDYVDDYGIEWVEQYNKALKIKSLNKNYRRLYTYDDQNKNKFTINLMDPFNMDEQKDSPYISDYLFNSIKDNEELSEELSEEYKKVFKQYIENTLDTLEYVITNSPEVNNRQYIDSTTTKIDDFLNELGRLIDKPINKISINDVWQKLASNKKMETALKLKDSYEYNKYKARTALYNTSKSNDEKIINEAYKKYERKLEELGTEYINKLRELNMSDASFKTIINYMNDIDEIYNSNYNVIAYVHSMESKDNQIIELTNKEIRKNCTTTILNNDEKFYKTKIKNIDKKILQEFGIRGYDINILTNSKTLDELYNKIDNSTLLKNRESYFSFIMYIEQLKLDYENSDEIKNIYKEQSYYTEENKDKDWYYFLINEFELKGLYNAKKYIKLARQVHMFDMSQSKHTTNILKELFAPFNAVKNIRRSISTANNYLSRCILTEKFVKDNKHSNDINRHYFRTIDNNIETLAKDIARVKIGSIYKVDNKSLMNRYNQEINSTLDSCSNDIYLEINAKNINDVGSDLKIANDIRSTFTKVYKNIIGELSDEEFIRAYEVYEAIISLKKARSSHNNHLYNHYLNAYKDALDQGAQIRTEPFIGLDSIIDLFKPEYLYDINENDAKYIIGYLYDSRSTKEIKARIKDIDKEYIKFEKHLKELHDTFDDATQLKIASICTDKNKNSNTKVKELFALFHSEIDDYETYINNDTISKEEREEIKNFYEYLTRIVKLSEIDFSLNDTLLLDPLEYANRFANEANNEYSRDYQRLIKSYKENLKNKQNRLSVIKGKITRLKNKYSELQEVANENKSEDETTDEFIISKLKDIEERKQKLEEEKKEHYKQIKQVRLQFASWLIDNNPKYVEDYKNDLKTKWEQNIKNYENNITKVLTGFSKDITDNEKTLILAEVNKYLNYRYIIHSPEFEIYKQFKLFNTDYADILSKELTENLLISIKDTLDSLKGIDTSIETNEQAFNKLKDLYDIDNKYNEYTKSGPEKYILKILHEENPKHIKLGSKSEERIEQLIKYIRNRNAKEKSIKLLETWAFNVEDNELDLKSSEEKMLISIYKQFKKQIDDIKTKYKKETIKERKQQLLINSLNKIENTFYAENDIIKNDMRKYIIKEVSKIDIQFLATQKAINYYIKLNNIQGLDTLDFKFNVYEFDMEKHNAHLKDMQSLVDVLNKIDLYSDINVKDLENPLYNSIYYKLYKIKTKDFIDNNGDINKLLHTKYDSETLDNLKECYIAFHSNGLLKYLRDSIETLNTYMKQYKQYTDYIGMKTENKQKEKYIDIVKNVIKDTVINNKELDKDITEETLDKYFDTVFEKYDNKKEIEKLNEEEKVYSKYKYTYNDEEIYIPEALKKLNEEEKVQQEELDAIKQQITQQENELSKTIIKRESIAGKGANTNSALYKRYYNLDKNISEEDLIKDIITRLQQTEMMNQKDIDYWFNNKEDVHLHNSFIDVIITMFNQIAQNKEQGISMKNFYVLDMETLPYNNQQVPYQITLIEIKNNKIVHIFNNYYGSSILNDYEIVGDNEGTKTLEYGKQLNAFYEQQKSMYQESDEFKKYIENVKDQYKKENNKDIPEDILEKNKEMYFKKEFEKLLAKLNTVKNTLDETEAIVKLLATVNAPIVAQNGKNFDFPIFNQMVKNYAQRLIQNEYYHLYDKYRENIKQDINYNDNNEVKKAIDDLYAQIDELSGHADKAFNTREINKIEQSLMNVIQKICEYKVKQKIKTSIYSLGKLMTEEDLNNFYNDPNGDYQTIYSSIKTLYNLDSNSENYLKTKNTIKENIIKVLTDNDTKPLPTSLEEHINNLIDNLKDTYEQYMNNDIINTRGEMALVAKEISTEVLKNLNLNRTEQIKNTSPKDMIMAKQETIYQLEQYIKAITKTNKDERLDFIKKQKELIDQANIEMAGFTKSLEDVEKDISNTESDYDRLLNRLNDGLISYNKYTEQALSLLLKNTNTEKDAKLNNKKYGNNLFNADLDSLEYAVKNIQINTKNKLNLLATFVKNLANINNLNYYDETTIKQLFDMASTSYMLDYLTEGKTINETIDEINSKILKYEEIKKNINSKDLLQIKQELDNFYKTEFNDKLETFISKLKDNNIFKNTKINKYFTKKENVFIYNKESFNKFIEYFKQTISDHSDIKNTAEIYNLIRIFNTFTEFTKEYDEYLSIENFKNTTDYVKDQITTTLNKQISAYTITKDYLNVAETKPADVASNIKFSKEAINALVKDVLGTLNGNGTNIDIFDMLKEAVTDLQMGKENPKSIIKINPITNKEDLEARKEFEEKYANTFEDNKSDNAIDLYEACGATKVLNNFRQNNDQLSYILDPDKYYSITNNETETKTYLTYDEVNDTVCKYIVNKQGKETVKIQYGYTLKDTPLKQQKPIEKEIDIDKFKEIMRNENYKEFYELFDLDRSRLLFYTKSDTNLDAAIKLYKFIVNTDNKKYDSVIDSKKFTLKDVKLVNLTAKARQQLTYWTSVLNYGSQKEGSYYNINNIYNGIKRKIFGKYKALDPGKILNGLPNTSDWNSFVGTYTAEDLDKLNISATSASEGSAGLVFSLNDYYTPDATFAQNTNPIRLVLISKLITAKFTPIGITNELFKRIDSLKNNKNITEAIFNIDDQAAKELNDLVDNNNLHKSKNYKEFIAYLHNTIKTKNKDEFKALCKRAIEIENYRYNLLKQHTYTDKDGNKKYQDAFIPNVETINNMRRYKNGSYLQTGINAKIAYVNDPRAVEDTILVDADFAKAMGWTESNKTWTDAGFKGAVKVVNGLEKQYGTQFVANGESIIKRGCFNVSLQLALNKILNLAYNWEQENFYTFEDVVSKVNRTRLKNKKDQLTDNEKVILNKEYNQFVNTYRKIIDDIKNNKDDIIKIIDSKIELDNKIDVAKYLNNKLNFKSEVLTKEDPTIFDYSFIVRKHLNKDNSNELYKALQEDVYIANNKDNSKIEFDTDAFIGTAYIRMDNENFASHKQTNPNITGEDILAQEDLDSRGSVDKGALLSFTLDQQMAASVGYRWRDFIVENKIILKKARTANKIVENGFTDFDEKIINELNAQQIEEKDIVEFTNNFIEKYANENTSIWIQNKYAEMFKKYVIAHYYILHNIDTKHFKYSLMDINNMAKTEAARSLVGNSGLVYEYQYSRHLASRSQIVGDTSLKQGEIRLPYNQMLVLLNSADIDKTIKTDLVSDKKLEEYRAKYTDKVELVNYLIKNGIYEYTKINGKKHVNYELKDAKYENIGGVKTLIYVGDINFNTKEGIYKTEMSTFAVRVPVQNYNAIPIVKVIGSTTHASTECFSYIYKMIGGDNDGDTAAFIPVDRRAIKDENSPLAKLDSTKQTYYDSIKAIEGTDIETKYDYITNVNEDCLYLYKNDNRYLMSDFTDKYVSSDMRYAYWGKFALGNFKGIRGNRPHYAYYELWNNMYSKEFNKISVNELEKIYGKQLDKELTEVDSKNNPSINAEDTKAFWVNVYTLQKTKGEPINNRVPKTNKDYIDNYNTDTINKFYEDHIEEIYKMRLIDAILTENPEALLPKLNESDLSECEYKVFKEANAITLQRSRISKLGINMVGSKRKIMYMGTATSIYTHMNADDKKGIKWIQYYGVDPKNVTIEQLLEKNYKDRNTLQTLYTVSDKELKELLDKNFKPQINVSDETCDLKEIKSFIYDTIITIKNLKQDYITIKDLFSKTDLTYNDIYEALKDTYLLKEGSSYELNSNIKHDTYISTIIKDMQGNNNKVNRFMLLQLKASLFGVFRKQENLNASSADDYIDQYKKQKILTRPLIDEIDTLAQSPISLSKHGTVIFDPTAKYNEYEMSTASFIQDNVKRHITYNGGIEQDRTTAMGMSLVNMENDNIKFNVDDTTRENQKNERSDYMKALNRLTNPKQNKDALTYKINYIIKSELFRNDFTELPGTESSRYYINTLNAIKTIEDILTEIRNDFNSLENNNDMIERFYEAIRTLDNYDIPFYRVCNAIFNAYTTINNYDSTYNKNSNRIDKRDVNVPILNKTKYLIELYLGKIYNNRKLFIKDTNAIVNSKPKVKYIVDYLLGTNNLDTELYLLTGDLRDNSGNIHSTKDNNDTVYNRYWNVEIGANTKYDDVDSSILQRSRIAETLLLGQPLIEYQEFNNNIKTQLQELINEIDFNVSVYEDNTKQMKNYEQINKGLTNLEKVLLEFTKEYISPTGEKQKNKVINIKKTFIDINKNRSDLKQLHRQKELIEKRIENIKDTIYELEKMYEGINDMDALVDNLKGRIKTLNQEINDINERAYKYAYDTNITSLVPYMRSSDMRSINDYNININRPKLLTTKDLKDFQHSKIMEMEKYQSNLNDFFIPFVMNIDGKFSLENIDFKKAYKFYKEHYPMYKFTGLRMTNDKQQEGLLKGINDYAKKDEQQWREAHPDDKPKQIKENIKFKSVKELSNFFEQIEGKYETEGIENKFKLNNKEYIGVEKGTDISLVEKYLTPTLIEYDIKNANDLKEFYKQYLEGNYKLGITNTNDFMEAMDTSFVPYKLNGKFSRVISKLNNIEKTLMRFSVGFIVRNAFDTMYQTLSNMDRELGYKGSYLINFQAAHKLLKQSEDIFNIYQQLSEERLLTLTEIQMNYKQLKELVSVGEQSLPHILDRLDLIIDKLNTYADCIESIQGSESMIRTMSNKARYAKQLINSLQLTKKEISTNYNKDLILKNKSLENAITFLMNIQFAEYYKLYDGYTNKYGQYTKGLRVDSSTEYNETTKELRIPYSKIRHIIEKQKDIQGFENMLFEVSALMNTQAEQDYLKEKQYDVLNTLMNNYLSNVATENNDTYIRDIENQLSLEDVQKEINKAKANYKGDLAAWFAKHNNFDLYEHANTLIENRARIIGFIFNRNMYGHSFDTSVSNSLKNWFNYGLRSPLETQLMYDMPYISFPIRSIRNWSDRILNPRFAVLMDDIIDGVYGQYEDEDGQFNEWIKFMIANGWLPITNKFGIRMGNGMFDVLSLLNNTSGYIEQRRSPLLQAVSKLIDTQDWKQAISKLAIIGATTKAANIISPKNITYKNGEVTLKNKTIGNSMSIFFDYNNYNDYDTYNTIGNYSKYTPNKYKLINNNRWIKYENIYKEYYTKYGKRRSQSKDPYDIVQQIKWNRLVQSIRNKYRK